jgi:alkylation response protein AidB-like acyl-CoA dehydrogenase
VNESTSVLSYLSASDDEVQFEASVERVLQREYDRSQKRQLAGRTAGPVDRAFWKMAGDLGWLAACIPESAGGYGSSATLALILLEQFGRALVIEPLLHGLLVPVAVVAHAEPGAAAERLAPLMTASEIWGLAWSGGSECNEASLSEIGAARETMGWRLSGSKGVVLGAAAADKLIIPASTGAGCTLFVVAARDITALSERRTIDGRCAAELMLDGVFVPDSAVVGDVGGGRTSLQRGLDWGIGGSCAEAIGAMQAAFALTLDYAHTRKQFGQAIGSFQVVQHRLADMALEIEVARSLLVVVTKILSEGGSRSSLSAARWRIMEAARYVLSDAVQLHGGIGVTDEALVSHYFRRGVALDLAWGSAGGHLEDYRRTRTLGLDLIDA